MLYIAAVCYYKEELCRPASDCLGLCKICKEVSNKHFAKTYNRIVLSRSTLADQVNGVHSHLCASAEWTWETKEEAEQIINFAVEMAQHGFPLSCHQLCNHANTILKSRLGDKFPETGVGKNWVERFMDRHTDRVRIFRSCRLDKKRAGAVNPTTTEAWFKLLSDYINKYNFSLSYIYGSDETRF